MDGLSLAAVLILGVAFIGVLSAIALGFLIGFVIEATFGLNRLSRILVLTPFGLFPLFILRDSLTPENWIATVVVAVLILAGVPVGMAFGRALGSKHSRNDDSAPPTDNGEQARLAVLRPLPNGEVATRPADHYRIGDDASPYTPLNIVV